MQFRGEGAHSRDSGMEESKAGALIPLDCKVQPFRALLAYIYSDAITCTGTVFVCPLLASVWRWRVRNTCTHALT
jgi:hypothetical protein